MAHGGMSMSPARATGYNTLFRDHPRARRSGVVLYYMPAIQVHGGRKPPLNFRISQAATDALDELAARRALSRSDRVRSLIDAALADAQKRGELPQEVRLVS